MGGIITQVASQNWYCLETKMMSSRSSAVDSSKDRCNYRVNICHSNRTSGRMLLRRKGGSQPRGTIAWHISREESVGDGKIV